MVPVLSTDDDVLRKISGYIEGKGARMRAAQQKVWDILRAILQSKSQQILVLDGLDEYDRNEGCRASFLRNLQTTAKDTSTRILLASRDESDIRHEVVPQGHELKHWKFFHLPICEQRIRPDILRFSSTSSTRGFQRRITA